MILKTVLILTLFVGSTLVASPRIRILFDIDGVFVDYADTMIRVYGLEPVATFVDGNSLSGIFPNSLEMLSFFLLSPEHYQVAFRSSRPADVASRCMRGAFSAARKRLSWLPALPADTLFFWQPGDTKDLSLDEGSDLEWTVLVDDSFIVVPPSQDRNLIQFSPINPFSPALVVGLVETARRNIVQIDRTFVAELASLFRTEQGMIRSELYRADSIGKPYIDLGNELLASVRQRQFLPVRKYQGCVREIVAHIRSRFPRLNIWNRN